MPLADINLRHGPSTRPLHHLHATRRIEVAVPAAGIKYLRRHGRDRTAFATVPLTDNTPISISKTLTLLPPR